MENNFNCSINEVKNGFKLIKKEFVKSKNSYFYTFLHEKTKSELVYFERDDENKTFAVSFKTLPEDSTGVFHILEHSVLNGSKKYPVKEPFVSMLQSSMQTFLNAMTYSDKTVFPISSRNDKDFFNLMSVYLDAVFSPLIYEKEEIFMQEGWHYEKNESDELVYNGVVFSEMKGAYSDVYSIIEDESAMLLFPDNSYGYSSGGLPLCIPDLTYEKFLQTHKRFYHPSNAKFFLDGKMDILSVLQFIDNEYLSKYEYSKPDFDFKIQEPHTGEKTAYYCARSGEEELCHVAVSKIFCLHNDVEKYYAAEVLADYLTGSNEAVLKRAVLENSLSQDVELRIYGEVYEPFFSLVFSNAKKENISAVKDFVPKVVQKILKDGLDKEVLSACIERLAFINREISQPYGVELCTKALAGWLYGDDPLQYIETQSVFQTLRDKIATDYFENLLYEMLGNNEDKSYLYVMPSLNKVQDDAKQQEEKLKKAACLGGKNFIKEVEEKFNKMKNWQQREDSEESLATLPRLDLSDVALKINFASKEKKIIDTVETLKIKTDTNGVSYLNLYFDVSDFSIEELRLLNVWASMVGELSTENYSADILSAKMKSVLGSFEAKIEVFSKPKDLEKAKIYLLISSSMLEEKVFDAIALIKEIILNSRYDETDKVYDILVQNDYAYKQALVNNGHTFAMLKSLSSFSKSGLLNELLLGESYVKYFTSFCESFDKNKACYENSFKSLCKKAFAKNRLFIGLLGNIKDSELKAIASSLNENSFSYCENTFEPSNGNYAVEIPSSVGFSAFGGNIYAFNGELSGTLSVLATLVSYVYLWNMVRVQGGAYGTGMKIRQNGDIFCYSYRDPNLQNSKDVFKSISKFLLEYLKEANNIDDMIIGTVNTTQPLLEPAEICADECRKYLCQIEDEDILRIRKEILQTKAEDLKQAVSIIKAFEENGKLSLLGDKDLIAFEK